MRLGQRIFLCYLLIFAGCVYFPVNWMWGTLRTHYLEGVEEPLADAANVIASLLEDRLTEPGFEPLALDSLLARAHDRKLDARIYNLHKDRVDLQLYATDASGTVLLDTREPSALGESYARWRDVKLTLDGRYGARITPRKDGAEAPVMYVAAPLMREGRIAGVLTLAEPTASVESFLRLARPQIVFVSLLALGVAALLSLAASYGLTRPIGRLARYANAIGAGERPPFPELGRTEIADLGRALRRMQEALDGRNYAEQYVQTLTHELKSPLSAIRGAVELLQEDLPEQQRARFIANIRGETERIGTIVERMLELATLENRRDAPETGPVDLAALLHTVLEAQQAQLAARKLKLETALPERTALRGNSFLLHQALANLVQNAIDFSPVGGTIEIRVQRDGEWLRISVADQGPGLPPYAAARIFERFYSLPRPDTGRRSTGLGLKFVREVAMRHEGSITLGNRPGGGAEAVLSLPDRS